MTPLPTITLRFKRLPKKKKDPEAVVPVSVHFDDQDTETFDFANPLTDANLTDLRWYLERYILWPSGPDYDRAREIEAALPQWGKALFEAVFKASNPTSAEAFGIFRDFENARRGAPGGTLVIDTTEPRILRLPWELLADEGGYLFSKQPPVQVRRRLHKTAKSKSRDFSPPLRVLVVISRPEDAGFIDPRSIAGPLLEALEGLNERVAVEFLRPPTLTALTSRLRDEQAPPVDIVHFDGHGVYDPGMGLGFLLFEDDEYQKDLVDAERLGTLLNDCGIPLVVLNACQSAQPDESNPFGSVAARLIESGVGGVVAMNYSVLVETAKRLAGSFYGGLARGQSAGAALDAARFALLADTKRIKRYHPEHGEEILHLQDWFLPALYQQAADLTPFPVTPPLPLGEGTGVRSGDGVRSKRVGFPPEPVYGFHGRAQELLALERAFAHRPIVLLHGFGGQGKTALAAHAADWFTRTGLFQRAVFLSFEQGADLDVALAAFGRALVGENFAIHEGDPVATIGDALAETPTLMVWDNFESVLPGGNAPLSAEELGRLLDAAAQWFPKLPAASYKPQAASPAPHSPLSRLLVTTRNPEIDHPAFRPGRAHRRELEGLLPDDALELAAAVLDDYGIERPARDPLARLMDFLGCHPLSLQLTLPHLADYGVDDLIERYADLLPGFKEGEAKQRNESLEVSLRFSLDRLGEEARGWLPRLSVFEGGAVESQLLAITEIPEAAWAELKTLLANTALIRIEDLPGVTVPYLHFHPTLVPYLRKQWEVDGGQWAAPDPEDSLPAPLATLHEHYWQEYYRFANFLYQTDTQHPIPARALAAREMPNLRRALALALAAGALDEAVAFANSINRFLDVFGRWRERDEVSAQVSGVMGQVSGEGGELTQSQYLMESQRGERLWQMGRAAEAEAVFRTLLERFAESGERGASAWGYERTLTLGRLGRCLRAQGQPRAAEAQYRAAIRVADTLLSSTPSINSGQALSEVEGQHPERPGETGVVEGAGQIKRHLGVLHTDLADVLADQGRYAEAEETYLKSLEIKKSFGGDARGEATVLGQLGTLALLQRQYAEARRRYAEALDLSQRRGEPRDEAVWWHQLGIVAQKEENWDEAGRCYQQSLEISERIGNLPYAASTANQLAIVAKNAGRPAEAERWYLRALAIDSELGSQRDVAIDYSNLANLYLSQNRLDEAEAYALRAWEIDKNLDLSVEPWKDCSILAKIAAAKGDTAAARGWRRQEQETFAAFPGNSVQLQQYEPLIQALAAACQGNEQALAQIEPALKNMEQADATNQAFAASARKLLAGERDLDALTEELERITGLVIRRVLERLGGEADPLRPTAGATSPAAGEEGERSSSGGGALTIEQVFELVGRAVGERDQKLSGQLFGTFQQMAADPNTPPAMQELAKALVLVLLGDQNPNLEALQAAEPQLASAVRGLLGRLYQ